MKDREWGWGSGTGAASPSPPVNVTEERQSPDRKKVFLHSTDARWPTHPRTLII